MAKLKNNMKPHLVRAKDVICKDSENAEIKFKAIDSSFKAINNGTFQIKTATTQDILDLFDKN